MKISIDENKEKVIQSFKEYKATSVHFSKKLYEITRNVRRFIYSNSKPLKDFQEEDLVKFLNAQSKYKTRTINDMKVYIKTFIKWYFLDFSARFRNLDKLCRNEKPEKAHTPDEMLTREEFQKLVQAEHSPYWKTYFMVLFYGGFRPTEVCNLECKQISFENDGTAFITIFSKKNKRDFLKFIPKEAAFYLKKQIQNGSKFVFPSILQNRKELPISTMAVYQRLTRLSQKILRKKVVPYVIRHSIATILYNRDDLKDSDVANQMGHSKDMKETYLNLDEAKIKARARKVWDIKAEELPDKEKHELEQKVELLQEKIRSQNAELTKFNEKMKMVNLAIEDLKNIQQSFSGLKLALEKKN